MPHKLHVPNMIWGTGKDGGGGGSIFFFWIADTIPALTKKKQVGQLPWHEDGIGAEVDRWHDALASRLVGSIGGCSGN